VSRRERGILSFQGGVGKFWGYALSLGSKGFSDKKQEKEHSY